VFDFALFTLYLSCLILFCRFNSFTLLLGVGLSAYVFTMLGSIWRSLLSFVSLPCRSIGCLHIFFSYLSHYIYFSILSIFLKYSSVISFILFSISVFPSSLFQYLLFASLASFSFLAISARSQVYPEYLLTKCHRLIYVSRFSQECSRLYQYQFHTSSFA